MVHYQGFEADDNGEIKRTEEFEAPVRICIKCGKELNDENTAKSETREITTGAMDGRKAVDIWCANCGQRNIFVQPVER
jgi:DNA-directed RNA polymerase subunit RPC12/RpoP